MKTFYTAPEDLSFFQSYSGLVGTLRTVGYLSQAISALTEFGVIFALVQGSLKEVFPEIAFEGALLGAALGTLFLEAGLRKFLPFAFRAFLYRRFKGLHLFISLSIVLVATALVLTSGYLSFHGGKEVAVQAAPAPVLKPEAPILHWQETERTKAMSEYIRDSAAIDLEYLGAQKELEARYAQERQTRARQRDGIVAGFGILRARQASESARLAQGRAKELRAAHGSFKLRMAQIEQETKRKLDGLEQANAEAAMAAKQKANRYGGGLAWFTVIALGILIFAIGIEETHRRGAGIQEMALLDAHTFNPGLEKALIWNIAGRWERYWRSKLDPPRENFLRLRGTIEFMPEPVPAQQVENGAMYAETVDSNPGESGVLVNRVCVHCSSPYTPRKSWQRFCSSKCRLAYHGKIHGKQYLPRKVYQARRREAAKGGMELFEGVEG
jgi:hypothetical protein